MGRDAGVDYIENGELDGSRVGLMGISGGGTVTHVRRRARTTRQGRDGQRLPQHSDSVGSLSHCIDNYVPGILDWAEMHDIAGLIAPRPLLAESGELDNIFPIKASVESFGQCAHLPRVRRRGSSSSTKCLRASIRSGASAGFRF